MRSALLPVLLLFAGCTNVSRLNPACELGGGPTGHLVEVEQGQSLSHILLLSQDTQPAKLVALNPVGARLFEGTLVGGTIQVTAAPHYRGPEPSTLLWAFALWRMRDRASTCWPAAAGETLTQAQNGSLELMRRQKLLAQWSPAAPEALTLPSANTTFSFQEME